MNQPMPTSTRVALWATIIMLTGIILTYSWEVRNGTDRFFDRENPTGCIDFVPGEPQ